MGLGEARVGVKPESPTGPLQLNPLIPEARLIVLCSQQAALPRLEAGSPWKVQGARLSAGLAAVWASDVTAAVDLGCVPVEGLGCASLTFHGVEPETLSRLWLLSFMP